MPPCFSPSSAFRRWPRRPLLAVPNTRAKARSGAAPDVQRARCLSLIAETLARRCVGVWPGSGESGRKAFAVFDPSRRRLARHHRRLRVLAGGQAGEVDMVRDDAGVGSMKDKDQDEFTHDAPALDVKRNPLCFCQAKHNGEAAARRRLTLGGRHLVAGGPLGPTAGAAPVVAACRFWSSRIFASAACSSSLTAMFRSSARRAAVLR